GHSASTSQHLGWPREPSKTSSSGGHPFEARARRSLKRVGALTRRGGEGEGERAREGEGATRRFSPCSRPFAHSRARPLSSPRLPPPRPSSPRPASPPPRVIPPPSIDTLHFYTWAWYICRSPRYGDARKIRFAARNARPVDPQDSRPRAGTRIRD